MNITFNSLSLWIPFLLQWQAFWTISFPPLFIPGPPRRNSLRVNSFGNTSASVANIQVTVAVISLSCVLSCATLYDSGSGGGSALFSNFLSLYFLSDLSLSLSPSLPMQKKGAGFNPTPAQLLYKLQSFCLSSLRGAKWDGT